MKIIFKILLFPLSLTITILTSFINFLLSISKLILSIFMFFCIIGAIASFVQGEVRIGVEALVIAILFSPYGIPVIGDVIVSVLESISAGIRAI